VELNCNSTVSQPGVKDKVFSLQTPVRVKLDHLTGSSSKARPVPAGARSTSKIDSFVGALLSLAHLEVYSYPIDRKQRAMTSCSGLLYIFVALLGLLQALAKSSLSVAHDEGDYRFQIHSNRREINNADQRKRTLEQDQQDEYFFNVDLSKVSLCGCNSCYDREYVTRSVGQTPTCAKRINQLMMVQSEDESRLSEQEACQQVTSADDECATICDINLCDGRADQTKPRDQDNDNDNNADILAAQEKTFCGCQSCTQDVWLSMAGAYSCGARISYLTDYKGKTEEEACMQVGGTEFPAICQGCNPATCPKAENSQLDMGVPSNIDSSSVNNVVVSTTVSSSNTNGGVATTTVSVKPTPTNQNRIPLTPDFPLYCFPDYNQRKRYENVWGKYTVEVKESATACGPSDNMFTQNAVHVDDTNGELKLQFKKVGDQWEAGEVRVLLPQEEMPFHYGEYSFSVKSVQVIDTSNQQVMATKLPSTMILGLFTW